MSKLIVEISDKIHNELKKTAANHGITLKEIVTSLIDNFLVEQNTKHYTDSGFCGKWEDSRSAKQIIDDIKSHRKWSKHRKDF